MIYRSLKVSESKDTRNVLQHQHTNTNFSTRIKFASEPAAHTGYLNQTFRKQNRQSHQLDQCLCVKKVSAFTKHNRDKTPCAKKIPPTRKQLSSVHRTTLLKHIIKKKVSCNSAQLSKGRKLYFEYVFPGLWPQTSCYDTHTCAHQAFINRNVTLHAKESIIYGSTTLSAIQCRHFAWHRWSAKTHSQKRSTSKQWSQLSPHTFATKSSSQRAHIIYYQ